MRLYSNSSIRKERLFPQFHNNKKPKNGLKSILSILKFFDHKTRITPKTSPTFKLSALSSLSSSRRLFPKLAKKGEDKKDYFFYTLQQHRKKLGFFSVLTKQFRKCPLGKKRLGSSSEILNNKYKTNQLLNSISAERLNPNKSNPLPQAGDSRSIFSYYIGFFVILLLLPIFYWDGSNQSLFLNWLEARGFPLNTYSSINYPMVSPSGSGSPLPEVVLISNSTTPNFLAWSSGSTFLEHQDSDIGNISSNQNQTKIFKVNMMDRGVEPQSFSKNNSIINYESTNETISEDNIGDWVDENEQDVFYKNINNPFTHDKNDKKKMAFDHRSYLVKEGDSLWSISKKFNVSIDGIISLNKITTPKGLITGQKLLIPRLSGAYYIVKKNDSLFEIAQNHDVAIDKIKQYNNLGGFLQIGKTLFLPGGQLSRYQKEYIFDNLFTSPVNGVITSKYGFRIHPIKGRRLFHTGIDIAKNEGHKVRATADGIVSYSDSNGGYGKYILLKHALDFETAYAHLDEVWVKRGQRVKKGQYIGKVGNTGLSTGPHLHFEVRQKGKFINPLRFVHY